MCTDTLPSRPSRGGTIAILHSPSPSPPYHLLFTNPPSHGTKVELLGPRSPTPSPHWIQIHQHGDLNRPSTRPEKSFFSFPINLEEESVGQSTIMHLPEQLALEVGGRGVVGRKVSIMRGRGEGARMVAEGVIGWN